MTPPEAGRSLTTEPADPDSDETPTEVRDTDSDTDTEQHPETESDPDDEAADSDDDRWTRFARMAEPTVPVSPPGRVKRALLAVARLARGETAIAGYVSLLLSAVMNWRVLRDPTGSIPHDLGDPLQQTYTLAWSGHAVWNDPGGLWNASNFYPEPLAYAFTDTLLGYLPAALIGGGYEAALLRYNILYLLTFALAFYGAYLLARQLGARVAGSAVAAAAFAYAPWKLAHGGHLNVLSIGGIALALAMLARGHGYSLRHGYRAGRTRWGWVVAGWLVAVWQVSLGFAIGVPFGYLLAAIALVALVVGLFKRHRVPWRVVVADVAGAAVFAGGALAMAAPYYRVLRDHPEAIRDLDYVDTFSPVWSSFLISPAESALWGQAHATARESMFWEAETTLLVGFAVIALALAGLVWSSWTVRQRVFLGGGVLLAVALTMGTNFIDDGKWAYVLAYQYLPGFDGLRTPGRLVLYVSLVAAILAAGTLTHLADRMDRYAAHEAMDARWRPGVPLPLRAALLLPVFLVLAEGYSAADVPEVPDSPVAMSQVEGPALILPSDGSRDFAAQYWTVDGFPRVVNGTAGFTPASQERIREDALTFPSPQSVDRLREDGIKTVVAVRDQLDGTPWEYLTDVPTSDDSITIEDHGSVVIYRL